MADEFCADTDIQDWVLPLSRPNWDHKRFNRVLAEFWEQPKQVAIYVPEAGSLEQRFLRLADRWTRETRFVSSGSDLINNASYQEIISMGWDVVPHLLADLQRNKRFWFPALAAITGVRPFDPSDGSNGRRMTEAWVRWGKRKGLI